MHPFLEVDMEQIVIGKLVNTHGLRGDVKIKPMTDFTDIRFRVGASIHLQSGSALLPLEIQSVKENKGMLFVHFVGYDDINLVEGWKGSLLSIDRDQTHALDEDEAYFFELKGCEVVDENGQFLGNVSEVLETSANAILRVKRDGLEFLVPYVKAFILDFSRSEHKVTIRMMEGLL